MKKKFMKMCTTFLSVVMIAGTIGSGKPVASKAAETTLATTVEETRLNITSKTAGVGVTKANRVTLQLKNAIGDVTWSSEDDNRVKIYPKSNGTVWVYASNYGNGKAVKVTALDENGSYTCKITPKKPSASKPFLSYTTYTGIVGDTVTLKVYNYSGKIAWKCGNTCASVTKTGKVTLKKAGTVEVIATLEDGTTLTCMVKVLKATAASYFEYNQTDDGNIQITGLKDESLKKIVIPDKIKGRKVTSIGDCAFEGCGSLSSIKIPSGVTSIGESAFNYCYSLTSITIPSGVTSIGDYAFKECLSLTSITIPSGVTSIGDYAFAGCSNLTSIKIPSGVTSIGDEAFTSCNSLASITIPSGVTSIGWGTFAGCNSLTSITIPSGVTSIKDQTFSGCSSLTSIKIPSGVTSIGEAAFSSCRSLTSITIPSGVTSIGWYGFSWCRSLTSITIPSSVTEIGYDAFSGCEKLEVIIAPKGSYAEQWAKEEGFRVKN